MLQYTLVFSTYVEVFPSFVPCLSKVFGLLHVRGGVSLDKKREEYVDKSSPRTWRCFGKGPTSKPALPVFSTYVEVFPTPRR